MGLYAMVRNRALSYYGGDAEKAGLALLHPAAKVASFPYAAGISRMLFSVNMHKDFSDVFPGYFGPSFSNPLSVPAGFDKNCDYIMLAYALGFGYHVVGSISENVRQGNQQRPRIASLDDFGAAWNRMGLNNVGAREARKKIKAVPKHVRNNFPIFASVVQDPDASSLEEGIRSMRASIGILYSSVDGFEIDVSCPNAYSAKAFENPEALEQLLGEIHIEKASSIFAKKFREYRKKPLLLKFSPYLDASEYQALIEVGNRFDIAGYVLANTLPAQVWIDSLAGAQLRRASAALVNAGSYNYELRKFEGGISGKPLEEYVDRAVGIVRPLLDGRALVIVGGVNIENIATRLKQGNLVQSYTYFTQKSGPGFVRQMLGHSV